MSRSLGAFIAVAALLASPAIAGAAPTGGALPAPLVLEVAVAGVAGVPDNAVAAALNVTVVNPVNAGYLTVYPCGEATPATSNLNYTTDGVVPNLVLSGLSADGTVCIETSATTDVIVDLAGWVPAGSNLVPLSQPDRLLDTRRTGRAQARSTTRVRFAGRGAVPADAALAVFNLTAVGPGASGYLTAYPCGELAPATSSVNFAADEVIPNLVISRIGVGGEVCIDTTATTDIIVDVTAFGVASSSDPAMLRSPQRLLDTRQPGGVRVGTSPTALTVAGTAGVPATASAVLLNLTADGADGPGYVTAFPCGGAVPATSNLNFVAGKPTANGAIVAVGAAGRVCFAASAAVHLIVDISGSSQSPSTYVAVAPTRLYDSRQGHDPRCQRAVRVVGSQIEIIDLTSGKISGRSTALPAPITQWSAILTKGCDSVFVAGLVPGRRLGMGAYRLDLAGNVTRSFLPMSASLGSAIATESRILVWDFNRRAVVDNETGATVLSITPQPFAASLVGATPDESLIVLLTKSDSSGPFTLRYYSAGVELGSWVAPLGAYAFHISPDATYLSYLIGTGSVTTSVHVTTLDGTEVASLPPTTVVPGKWDWLSDGAMWLCQQLAPGAEAVAARWDLFSPPKPLAPANPTLPCVDDVA